MANRPSGNGSDTTVGVKYAKWIGEKIQRKGGQKKGGSDHGHCPWTRDEGWRTGAAVKVTCHCRSNYKIGPPHSSARVRMVTHNHSLGAGKIRRTSVDCRCSETPKETVAR